MALGASAANVVGFVIAEGMRPALAGIVIGAGGAFALGGVLSRLIYGVRPNDPLTFLAVALLLAAVAVQPVRFRRIGLRACILCRRYATNN
jgi:putative ABC transport system permease protein